MSTGLSFTAAVARKGELYTWGSGSHGQLGHGDTVEQSHPVEVESLSAIGAVAQVSTGSSFTLALMDDGDLYSFGYGANYCLGHDDTASEWQPRLLDDSENCFFTSVAAADEHSVAIDSQGQVRARFSTSLAFSLPLSISPTEVFRVDFCCPCIEPVLGVGDYSNSRIYQLAMKKL